MNVRKVTHDHRRKKPRAGHMTHRCSCRTGRCIHLYRHRWAANLKARQTISTARDERSLEEIRTGGIFVVRLVVELPFNPTVHGIAQSVDSTKRIHVIVAEASEIVFDGEKSETIVSRDAVATQGSPSRSKVGTFGEIVGR
jgi:hypothetical protein